MVSASAPRGIHDVFVKVSYIGFHLLVNFVHYSSSGLIVKVGRVVLLRSATYRTGLSWDGLAFKPLQ